jgi:hypothetical protein
VTAVSGDIVAFVRARCDDDEADARAVEGNGEWDCPSTGVLQLGGVDDIDGLVLAPRGVVYHAARWDPARVLREVDTRRRIIARHEGRHWCTPDPEDTDWTLVEAGEVVTAVYPCGHLRDLAAPDADHPDYDPMWTTN